MGCLNALGAAAAADILSAKNSGALIDFAPVLDADLVLAPKRYNSRASLPVILSVQLCRAAFLPIFWGQRRE